MTFLAPLFFAGLLAIALPIWLHRLSSENPNRQSFSSLMLLEPGEPRRVLAKNLQYLLLLALRIALLVLLVLAFAGPAIWQTPEAASSGEARLHLIVLDTSASMAYGDRWDEARELATELIADMDSDDRGQIVAAGRVAELLTQETGDPAVLRAAVASTEPGVFQLSFGQLMRALDGVIRGAELPVVLHLVTDAQISGLPLRFAELAPRERAEIRVHKLADEPAANWAVENVGGSPLTGEIQVSLRSFAPDAARRTVRLELEGQLIQQRTVEVPAGEGVTLEFEALDLRAGSNRVAITMSPGDELEADDTRFIALQRPVPRPALIVSDDLRGTDSFFVESALDTLTALVVDAEVIASGDLADRELGEYHFVIVTDAGTLNAGEASQLTDYVQSGGAVMIAMGRTSATVPAVPITEQPVQPSGLASSDFTAVGAIDVGHPGLRNVEALRAARFFRYANVAAAENDRVLISLESGAPLLLERELGAGQVLVYTSTLDREWNDLVVQPVFVPFISGLANHMLGGAGFSSVADLGSTLAVRAMGLAGGQIFDPRGNVALGLGGTGDVLLDQIGFYEVVGGGVSQLVAVNFDPRESDLSFADDEAVERWQRLGSEATGTQDAQIAAAQEADVLTPLGLWVLALLLAVIAMESWAGNWHLRVRRGLAA